MYRLSSHLNNAFSISIHDDDSEMENEWCSDYGEDCLLSLFTVVVAATILERVKKIDAVFCIVMHQNLRKESIKRTGHILFNDTVA